MDGSSYGAGASYGGDLSGGFDASQVTAADASQMMAVDALEAGMLAQALAGGSAPQQANPHASSDTTARDTLQRRGRPGKHTYSVRC